MPPDWNKFRNKMLKLHILIFFFIKADLSVPASAMSDPQTRAIIPTTWVYCKTYLDN